MQFHEKKCLTIFDFTSFFALTFLNFLARCVMMKKNYLQLFVYFIIQEDHWLRQRNGEWELKYPDVATENRGNANGSTTIYHETTNLEDVLKILKPILNSGGISFLKLHTYMNLKIKIKKFSSRR